MIEHNSFTPVEKRFDPVHAIKQISNMLETQLRNDDVKIWLDFDPSIKKELCGDVERIQ